MINDQTRQEAAQWFAALRRGPMSLDERASFDRWRADPTNQAALNGMHELWGEVANIGQFGISVPKRRVWPRRTAAAAAVAAIVTAAIYYLAIPTGGTPSSQQLATTVGEQRTTTMPDGSVLSMNVVTKLSYDVDPSRREVALGEGEAAFFVRKDRARPFVVTAAGYEIEAVGTAFNVRNRGGEVDVAVMEGVVAVRVIDGPRAGQEIARLDAGRRVELGSIEQLGVAPLRIDEIPGQRAAEWRIRTLTYDDAPVSRVVDDFNLYFAKPVEIATTDLANRRVTLRLHVEDRDRALSTLASLLEVEVRQAAAADVLAEQ